MLLREIFSNKITEMPMYHPPLSDHPLNTEVGNQEYFDRFIKTVKPIEELSHGVILYEGDYRTGGSYMAANPTTKKVYYMMTYRRDSNAVLGRFVYQKFLWIDKTARNVVGHLPSTYFYSLIDDYFTIATDSEQTTNGQRFWEHRIEEALGKNLNVYYYDDATGHIEQLHQPSDIHEFNAKYNIYSEEEGSLDRVFVISSKQLTKPDTNEPEELVDV